MNVRSGHWEEHLGALSCGVHANPACGTPSQHLLPQHSIRSYKLSSNGVKEL